MVVVGSVPKIWEKPWMMHMRTSCWWMDGDWCQKSIARMVLGMKKRRWAVLDAEGVRYLGVFCGR